MVKIGTTKASKAENGDCAMTFVCETSTIAKQAFLVGDFNAWDPLATRMFKRQGAFRKRISLPAGEHQYKFVVDGKWQTDPTAPAQVRSDLGSMNSLVKV